MTEKNVPTAALVEKINYQAKDGTMKDKIRIDAAVNILEDGDELVRRSDVEKLVENKIEEIGSDIDRQHYDSEDNPERKAVKILGELLEEIEE